MDRTFLRIYLPTFKGEQVIAVDLHTHGQVEPDDLFFYFKGHDIPCAVIHEGENFVRRFNAPPST